MPTSLPVTDGGGFRLKLESFRPFSRNTLKGFCTIKIEPLGLLIDDVHLHQAENGVRYALLPSKVQLRADGSVIRRDDGKMAYSPVLKFSSRDQQDRFSHAVVELVRRLHPEVLA